MRDKSTLQKKIFVSVQNGNHNNNLIIITKHPNIQTSKHPNENQTNSNQTNSNQTNNRQTKQKQQISSWLHLKQFWGKL